jgi:biotin operon repressor
MSKHAGARVKAHAILLELLTKGNVSRNVLSEQSGLSRIYILYYLKELRDRRLIYRSNLGYDLSGRLSVELFSLGDKPDVERSPKRSRRKFAVSTGDSQPVAATAPVTVVVPRTTWIGPISEYLQKMSPTAPNTRRKPLVLIPKAVSEITTTE